MEWYVFKENFNIRKIERFNIFSNKCFEQDVKEILKIKEISKLELAELLEEKLSYYYWSKHNSEIVVNSTISKKIDIYDQVMINWDRFVDYIWEVKINVK